jgi:hypothetical protein
MIIAIIALLLIGSGVTLTLRPFQKASAQRPSPPPPLTKLPPTSDQTTTSNPSDKKGALGLPANTNPNRGQQQPPQLEPDENVGINVNDLQNKITRGTEQLVELEKTPKHIPIATSDNNVYVSWPSNKTGNSEIMFKASTDNGKTFGEKINLSNSTGTESVDQEIAAAGNNVYISWWEVQQSGTREPVFIASNDNGKTFGEKVMLSAK